MGFFKNVGVSYEYLYDLMSFDPMQTSDIGSYEQDPGDVVEKAIIKEKSGFCIRIRRERQKRARLLRFSYADIIRITAFGRLLYYERGDNIHGRKNFGGKTGHHSARKSENKISR